MIRPVIQENKPVDNTTLIIQLLDYKNAKDWLREGRWEGGRKGSEGCLKLDLVSDC